jgi:hypothetical protein
MKSVIRLTAAALLAPLAAAVPSEAAFPPWHEAPAFAGTADGTHPLVLVNGPRHGGGGGGQRGGGRQNFNSNNFHSSVSNNHSVNRNANVNVNRNANVNVNRNVAVHGGGGCCYNYNSGPGWGGVAAGVAVGAVVGAAAASTVPAPPPYYPPGYVYVPQY